MNVLFANSHLREDEEFLNLVNEVVGRGIEEGLVGEEEEWVGVFKTQFWEGVLGEFLWEILV